MVKLPSCSRMEIWRRFDQMVLSCITTVLLVQFRQLWQMALNFISSVMVKQSVIALMGPRKFVFPMEPPRRSTSMDQKKCALQMERLRQLPCHQSERKGKGKSTRNAANLSFLRTGDQWHFFVRGKTCVRSRWIMWPGGMAGIGAFSPHFGGGSQPKTIQLDSGSKNSILPSRLCYHGSQWWPLVGPQQKHVHLVGGWVWEETEVSNISSVIVEKQGWW